MANQDQEPNKTLIRKAWEEPVVAGADHTKESNASEKSLIAPYTTRSSRTDSIMTSDPEVIPDKTTSFHDSLMHELGEDRAIKRNKFFNISSKNDGINAGYVGLKHLSPKDPKKNQPLNAKTNKYKHKWMVKHLAQGAVFKEYVGGNLMRFMLEGEQAPKMRLNITNNSEVTVCSRFLSNFKTLYDTMESGKKFDIRDYSAALVASMVISDPDAHTGNIGRVSTKDGQQLIGRIDFDQSLAFDKTFGERNYFDYILNAMDVTKYHPYNDVLTSEKFTSSLEKLKEINPEHLKSVIKKSVTNIHNAYKISNTNLNLDELKPLAKSLYGENANKNYSRLLSADQLSLDISANVSTRIKDLQILGKMISTTKELHDGKISLSQGCEAFRGFQKECSEANFQPFLRIAYKSAGSDIKFKSMINILDLEQRLDNKAGFDYFLANVNPQYQEGPPTTVFDEETNKRYQQPAAWYKYSKEAGPAPGFLFAESEYKSQTDKLLSCVKLAKDSFIIINDTSIKEAVRKLSDQFDNNHDLTTNNKNFFVSTKNQVVKVVTKSVSANMDSTSNVKFLTRIDQQLAKEIIKKSVTKIINQGIKEHNPSFIADNITKLNNPNLKKLKPSKSESSDLVKSCMLKKIAAEGFSTLAAAEQEALIKNLVESVPSDLRPSSLVSKKSETSIANLNSSDLKLADDIYKRILSETDSGKKSFLDSFTSFFTGKSNSSATKIHPEKAGISQATNSPPTVSKNHNTAKVKPLTASPQIPKDVLQQARDIVKKSPLLAENPGKYDSSPTPPPRNISSKKSVGR